MFSSVSGFRDNGISSGDSEEVARSMLVQPLGKLVRRALDGPELR